MRAAKLAALAVLATLATAALAPAAGLPVPGTKAPVFAIPDFHDTSKVLASHDLFRDRTTLVSFFATWCEPCKKELGELKRLDERHRGRGFQVVLVCLDIMGARNVRAYLEEAGAVGLRILTDRSGEASNRYGVMHLPTNVLVGPDGTVALSWDTYRPERLQEIEAYLSRLPVRPSAGSGGR